MKKSTYLLVFVVWLYCIEACKHATPPPQTTEKDTTVQETTIAKLAPDDMKRLDIALDKLCASYANDKRRSLVDTGIEVPCKCAELCFDNYDTNIRDAGYLPTENEVDQANRGGRPTPGAFRRMTTAELFSGTDFVCWLHKQHAIASASNETLQTKLRLGCYNDKFFKCLKDSHIVVDASIAKLKQKRTSIFVVVTRIVNKRAGEPKVYDFGGLQP